MFSRNDETSAIKKLVGHNCERCMRLTDAIIIMESYEPVFLTDELLINRFQSETVVY